MSSLALLGPLVSLRTVHHLESGTSHRDFVNIHRRREVPTKLLPWDFTACPCQFGWSAIAIPTMTSSICSSTENEESVPKVLLFEESVHSLDLQLCAIDLVIRMRIDVSVARRIPCRSSLAPPSKLCAYRRDPSLSSTVFGNRIDTNANLVILQRQLHRSNLQCV